MLIQGFTQFLTRPGEKWLCTPLQYIREFLRNGVEAVLRTRRVPDNVIIDVNLEAFEDYNAFKISFVDSGDGIVGPRISS